VNKYVIFCDFDGTITRMDTLVYLLDEFSGEDWRSIEDQVEAGSMTEIGALQAEMDLLHIPFEEAASAIRNKIQIDPTFPGFVEYLRKKDFDLTILSGGFKRIIELVLKEHNLDSVSVKSNQVEVGKSNKWQVLPAGTPKLNGFCNHCKTWHVTEAKAASYTTIYIGDGTTDRCPAMESDIVFAKGGLADWLTRNGREFVPFNNFKQITQYLEKQITVSV